MGNERMHGQDENLGAHGYQAQEIQGDEFVSVDEDSVFDDSEFDSYDDSEE